MYAGSARTILPAEECFDDSVTSVEFRGSGMFGPPAFNPGQPGYNSFLFKPYDGDIEEQGDFANVQGAIDYLTQQGRKRDSK